MLLLGHDPDNNRFESLGKLNGKQPGELFGASMIVSDINGDGLDDIIVGAPHYTDYNDYEIKFEIGAVYVYHQRTFASEERFRESDTILRGKHDGGRFGHAVAALGDVNGDDFNDVAVGAPYEGSGVVYIYHGSESGLKLNADQRICGDLFTPPLTSLGTSFAAGSVDMDDNGYADVIIGAYESDTVVYLPARPVVKIDIDFKFIPELINLDNKTCNMGAGALKKINKLFEMYYVIFSS